MRTKIIGLILFSISAHSSYAQQNNTPEQQELINLSKQKWDWMANKNVDSLNVLFADKSMFVHMGGSWGKT